MKMLLAIILLLSPAIAAKADRVLIYAGNETNHTTGDGSSTSGVAATMYLIDVDTDQEVLLFYTNTKANGKTYLVNLARTLYLDTVMTSAKASETFLLVSGTFMTNSTDHTYSGQIDTLTGNNSSQDFGGTFTGDYPKVLKYVSNEAFQQDSVQQETDRTGNFTVNMTLTRQVNDANDSLTDATNAVKAYLEKKGYKNAL